MYSKYYIKDALNIGWGEPDAAQIANISNFLIKNKCIIISACYD